MGFDNECILNIQSLAGEYFCPVCRTLVYPNEALQTQCTHLYCKPCLTYVASSTQACPYDGYLVTEAGSKPLTETNKALAETIGKIAVHCLYHRSGCTWQGPLSECTTHCTGCAFGNSPVVCNRCGVQIVHRQVQEHAQSCNVNGTNSQPQQGSDNVQPVATSGASVPIDQSKSVTQAGVPTSQPQASQTATGPPPGQNMNQLTTANPQPQPLTATAVPTPEQLYQQQYQQYYQQYPGYDPYQQAYQQYYPYQQQATPQFQQPPLQVQQAQSQAQHQPQSLPQPLQQIQAPPTHIQPQPHPQAQAQAQSNPLTQPQGQPQPQTHSQAQPHISSNGQPQHFYPQATVAGPNQNLAQGNPQQQPNPAIHPHVQNQPQNQPIAHGQMPPQSFSQVQPHLVQSHAQQHIQMTQYQQPHPQMYHPQPPQVHPHPQSQLQPHPQGHPQFQPHPQPHLQVQPPQPPNPQQAPVQSVAGHQSYPPQPHQQVQQTPPQPHPMQVQPSTGLLPPGQGPAQFAQPPPHMRPIQPPHMQSSQGQAPGIPPAAQHIHPHNHPGLSVHQPPAMHQVQQPMPHQYVQQPQAFAGQAAGSLQSQSHQSVPFGHQHSQARLQGPPQAMQQPPAGYVQPQQGAALPPGMQPHSSQSYGGRPPLLNQGGQSQQFPQSSGVAGTAPQARPPQFGSGQPSTIQNNMPITNQQHASSDQQHIQTAPPVSGAVVERKGHQTSERRPEQQEDESHSLKKSESEDNSFGANLNEVKSETGMKDEHKLGNGGGENYRRDETVAKDAVSEMKQVQGGSGDPVAAQRMKEEGKDSALDHSPGGKSVLNKAEDGGNVTMDSLKKGEVNVNVQGSTEGSLAVPPVNSQSPLSGRDRTQHGHHDRNFSQSQSMSHGQISDVSGGFPGKGFEQVSHPASLTDQGRFHHPPMPYGPPGSQQRPAAPSLLQSVPPTGHVPGQPPSHLRPPGHLPHPGQVSNRAEHFQPPSQNHPGPSHPEYPVGVPPGPGSASLSGVGPNNFPNSARNFEPQAAGPQGQYPGGIPPSSSAGFSRVSQGEPLGPPLSSGPLPHRPEGQTGSQHPFPMEADMYQNQRPPHFDSRRSDSHVPGNFERGPYGQPFGVESSSTRMNGAPPPGLDSSSAPAFRDEKFRAPPGERPDTFSLGPRRLDQGELKETSKQFPRPPHQGNEASPKFGSNSSRPIGGYGMDGPSRYLDKEPLGYGYDGGQRVDSGGPPSGFLPPYHSAGSLHPSESGGRPNPAMHHDNRGSLDYNRSNSDFLGPMHAFSRNHMDRLPPRSPGNPSRLFGAPHNIDDVDGRERHSFGERFPILPPGHLRRGEFDGPGNMRMEEQLRNGDLIGQEIPAGPLHRGQLFGPRNLSGRPHVGEPDFGSFQNYRRSGEPNGPGGFSHQHPFVESFGTKSSHPHLGEPGFRSSYSHQGFPDDSEFFAGGTDSFDKLRKRKTLSMGWCRICKVDCESPEGLDMHGQTREHQRMAMNMVKNIKQRTAKKKKTSNELSVREEESKLRNAGFHGHGSKA